MKNNLSQFIEKFSYHGLDALNDYIPRHETDYITQKVKSVLWVGIIFSVVLMGTSPNGFLYATFLRPIIVNVMLLHRIPLGERFTLTPESGMHYMTIFIYFMVCLAYIKQWEKEKIDMPIHKNIWNFCLMMFSLFIPFEFIYLALYDIFHSIPVYGYPVFLSYGWWLDFPMNIIKSILFVDGFFVIGSCYTLFYLSTEIKNKYPDIKILNFGKKTKIFFVLYVLIMALWVAFPLYSKVNFVWGTPYFPQTIYPEYGVYLEHNITHPSGESYGIINEYWIPNDLVKVWNHTSKAFSVLFVYNLLTPRKVKKG